MNRRLASVALALTLSAAAPSTIVLAAPTTAHASEGECESGGTMASLKKCAPEAPFPIGLPIAGLAVFGGYVLLVRRSGAARDAVNSTPAAL